MKSDGTQTQQNWSWDKVDADRSNREAQHQAQQHAQERALRRQAQADPYEDDGGAWVPILYVFAVLVPITALIGFLRVMTGVEKREAIRRHAGAQLIIAILVVIILVAIAK